MKVEHEEDFAAFVAGASDRLFRVAVAITRDETFAHEAVEAALGTIYRRWRRVAETADDAVRRCLLTEILGRQGGRTTPISPHATVPLRRTIVAGQSLTDTDAVWAALADLPIGQRAVLVLHLYEGLAPEQIARTLGVGPDVVRAQTAAALADLRGLLLIARRRASA